MYTLRPISLAALATLTVARALPTAGSGARLYPDLPPANDLFARQDFPGSGDRIYPSTPPANDLHARQDYFPGLEPTLDLSSSVATIGDSPPPTGTISPPLDLTFSDRPNPKYVELGREPGSEPGSWLIYYGYPKGKDPAEAKLQTRQSLDLTFSDGPNPEYVELGREPGIEPGSWLIYYGYPKGKDPAGSEASTTPVA